MTMDAGPEAKDCLTEVLISDPRNDDHLIIAQTVVLFHHLHNAVCDRLPRPDPPPPPEHFGEGSVEPSSAQSRDLFASARRLVTAVYREIVRNDLMKRLLCKPVYARYVDHPGSFLDAEGGTGMPVEFSHAAFRIGHAMVRPGYKIRDDQVFGLEDVLRFNSELLPDRMPPRWPWIIRWSQFYDLGKTPANLSRRLAPSQTRVLFKSPLISLMDDPEQFNRQTGLPRRDLLRGNATRMRSVESLIRHVKDSAPDLVAGSRLLSDPAHRRDVISTYLDAQGEPTEGAALTEGERDAIAADPPLLLFLLLEAAIEQEGCRLGVLGSVILAEVIFRALDEAERAEAGKTPDANALAAEVFPNDSMPRSMPDLIRFLANLPSLKDAKPAFV